MRDSTVSNVHPVHPLLTGSFNILSYSTSAWVVKKYTYMSSVGAKLSKLGAKLSKLDRFIACPMFLSSLLSLVVTSHSRELSYHNHITLISRTSDYSPPLFKLFNSWMMKDGFNSLIKKMHGTVLLVTVTRMHT